MTTRIGLVGVPGSGKTKLANAIKRAMPDEKFAIVDGYVERNQDALQMSVGVEATYLPNLHIAVEREKEIRRLVIEERNFIVCGTIFDTLCYTGFHAEVIANSPGDEEKKQGLLMREMTAAQMFAYLAVDSFINFTHLFYLPVTDPDLLVVIPYPNDKTEAPPEVQALDKTLQDALRRYGDPATVLKDKHHQNVKTVVDLLESEKHGTKQSPVAGG